MHLKAMATGEYPLGVIASLFRQHLAPLRTMCFLDNEYGDTADRSRVLSAAAHTLSHMRHALTRSGKPVRVTALQPSPSMQHHVEVDIEWRQGAVWRKRSIKVNLYIPNASVPQADEEQEEGITASGPRFSMTRLKGVARPRRGGDRVRRRQKARRKAIKALLALQAQNPGPAPESALEPKEKPAAAPRAAPGKKTR